jgi:hypothetical protein
MNRTLPRTSAAFCSPENDQRICPSPSPAFSQCPRPPTNTRHLSTDTPQTLLPNGRMDDSRLSASVGTVTHTSTQKATRRSNPPQQRPVETRLLFAHGPRERLAPDPPLNPRPTTRTPEQNSPPRSSLGPRSSGCVALSSRRLTDRPQPHRTAAEHPPAFLRVRNQLMMPQAQRPSRLTPHPHSTSLRPHSLSKPTTLRLHPLDVILVALLASNFPTPPPGSSLARIILLRTDRALDSCFGPRQLRRPSVG